MLSYMLLNKLDVLLQQGLGRVGMEMLSVLVLLWMLQRGQRVGFLLDQWETNISTLC